MLPVPSVLSIVFGWTSPRDQLIQLLLRIAGEKHMVQALQHLLPDGLQLELDHVSIILARRLLHVENFANQL